MRIEFVMDEAYLRAFHAEMVATRLPRWRLHQRVAWFSVVAGLGMLGWAVWADRADVFAFAVICGLVGGGMLWRLGRRRERWLAYQRRLPTYGGRVAIEVGDGELVQTSDRSPDVVSIRRGEILESPGGWFVTYDIVHLGTEPDDDAVNTDSASLYLPASAFGSGASRDAFVEAVDLAFAVKRL